MAGRTDLEQLIYQMSADIRRLEAANKRALKDADSTAGSIQRRYDKLGAEMGRNFGRASAAAGLAFGAIVAYATKAASDAAETANAFDVAFDGLADKARAFAQTYSKEVGRSFTEVQANMARTQLVLTGVGVSAEQALKMTEAIQARSVDIGSLFNVDDAQAFQAILSGIAGEAEPMKKFGVAVNDAAVKTELLRLGFKGSTQDATEAQKAVARLNIILRQSAKADGDAIRTKDGLANSTKRARAEFEAAAISLGQNFLPIATKATQAAAGLLAQFNAMPHEVKIAGLALLGLVAAAGPIAAVAAGLSKLIQLARLARGAIAGVGGASGLGASAGAGVAAAAPLATLGIGIGLIASGHQYQKTVKQVGDATDDAIVAALKTAQGQIKSAAKAGPGGKQALERYQRDAAILQAEQARRAKKANLTKGGAAGAPAAAAGNEGLGLESSFGLGSLAGLGGGKGKGSGSSKADKAKRDAERLAELQLRQQERTDSLLAQADEDLLSLQGRRVETAQARYDAEIAAIDRDRETRKTELAYAVQQKELTQQQADAVALKEESVRIQRRINADADRQEAQARDAYDLQVQGLDAQAEVLQLQSALARTAQQRREIEYSLLDLAEQRARADLDVIAATKGTASAEYQLAAAKLAALEQTRPLRQAVVDQDTQGPIQSYLSSLPSTIDQVNEAMQNMQAQGVSRLVDGLAAAAAGADNLGDVFRQTIQQMAIDANRILIQSALSGGTGGLGGLTKGFSFLRLLGGGNGFSLDANVLSLASKSPFLFAKGTDSAPRGWAIVGEEGPELIKNRGGEKIVPNDILRGMMGRREAPQKAANETYAPVVNITIHGAATAAQGRQTAALVAAETQKAMAGFRRRGY